MRKLTISDLGGLQEALRKAASRSGESRELHRLHQVMLVALGNSCYRVARWFGEDPRTVERWVQRFEKSGALALRNGSRSGRPPLLAADLTRSLPQLVAAYPKGKWSGRLLKEQLERRFGVALSLRQCQRLLRQIYALSGRPSGRSRNAAGLVALAAAVQLFVAPIELGM
ncbi:MAG: helix-turn-helix domain-containing protein [Betaproteobacteria bacterium]